MKKEIRDYIKEDRRDFQNDPLNKDVAPNNPFDLFELWFSELIKTEVLDPYAFTLATADSNGQPSARVLYMRDISPKGISCFTNYRSEKGQHISVNPKFCANFYWPELSRQVRFEGDVELLSAEASDEYYNSRPRESRIGAWASNQSQKLENRSELENRVAELTAQFEGREVKRPDHWGGYLLVPSKIEFWQGRENRLHDRLLYKKIDNNNWQLSRLSP